MKPGIYLDGERDADREVLRLDLDLEVLRLDLDLEVLRLDLDLEVLRLDLDLVTKDAGRGGREPPQH